MGSSKGQNRFTWTVSVDLAEDVFSIEDMGYSQEQWDRLTEGQRLAELDDWSSELADPHIKIRWKPCD